VNKALIHYHFNNKEALLGAVLDRYYQALASTIEQVLGQGGDLRAQALQLIDAYVDFLQQNRSFSRIVQREASGGRHMEPSRTRNGHDR